MAADTKIEWTDATWNPVRGCSRITTGCGGPNHEGGCYAEKIAARFSDPGQPFHGFAERTKHGGKWTGKLALIEDQLTLPLRWKKPRKIFVNSMSDLFHENLPDDAIDRVFAVMALAPQHTFQVLTKRAERMRDYFTKPHSAPNISLWQSGVCWAVDDLVPTRTDQSRQARDQVLRGPLPNVWLGVSAERQEEADERIPHLLNTSAAVRFVSAEPLLGPIDLENLPSVSGVGRYLNALNTAGAAFSDLPARLDWIIVGGESGPRARPMHPDWARSLRDQCAAAGVPFFFKQWGAFCPGDHLTIEDAWTEHLFDDGACVVRPGKKAAGRTLDGRTHDEFPKVVG